MSVLSQAEFEQKKGIKLSASNSAPKMSIPSFRSLNKRSLTTKSLVCDDGFAVAPAALVCDDGFAVTPAENMNIDDSYKEFSPIQQRKIKDVSIGAGARINQTLPKDTYPVDSWKDTPDAVMTIYFVFQEKFEELKAKGMRDFSGVPEGMLAGIPVG
jgi:hypothetical protein